MGQRVKKEIKKIVRVKESTIYQNIPDAAKSVLRCKFIVISVFLIVFIVGNKKDLKSHFTTSKN